MIPTPVLDRAVLILMALLYTKSPTVERLIRMGAHGEREPQAAARRLGYGSVNTLNGALRRLEVPPAGCLLMWGRLLLVLYLWEPSPKASKGAVLSLDELALRDGWSNSSVISNSLRHHAGIYPRAWHLSGESFDHLCHRFVRTWRARAGTKVAA